MSSESPSLNLHCNEEFDEAVSQEHLKLDNRNNCYSDSNSISYEESSIVNDFDSEIRQLIDSNLIQRFISNSSVVSYRLEAINWMLKVHGYCQFRPETAYRSVNYFDRFVLSTTMPKGKAWQYQLLSIACVSVAAKMEEIRVPLLLDLQMKEVSTFLFEPKTVQRMEVLVMASLKWRLRVITPFDFVNHFIAKFSCFGLTKLEHQNTIISHTSNILLQSCQVVEFMNYSPSTIAIAALLHATNQCIDMDEIRRRFHSRVRSERVKECYKLMKQNICVSAVGEIDASNSIGVILQLDNKSKSDCC